MRRLTMLIHGDSGHGKSWLGDSAPGPRLLLDVEGRAEYTPSRKVYWDPRGPLPATFADGTPIDTDTTVVVTVRDFPTFELVYNVLASGAHYFRSVILDSLTELQQRCMDNLIGTAQARTQDWGDLLRKMEATVRQYRDLRTHPQQPLDALVIIAGSHMKDGKQRPLLQGGISNKLAYHFDVVGYLQFEMDAGGQPQRVMAVQPYGLFVAKDNTDLISSYYGLSVVLPHKSEGRRLIEELLIVLNQPTGVA